MEVLGVFASVHPGDVIVWFLDTMAGVVVVEHNFARMGFLLLVYLPEDGGIGPVIAGADSVAHHLLHSFCEAEVFSQPDAEVVECAKHYGMFNFCRVYCAEAGCI